MVFKKLLLNPCSMSFVNEEALAGRHVPLADRRVGRPGHDVSVVHGNGVDVTCVSSEN
jgi:hypothetical protein